VREVVDDLSDEFTRGRRESVCELVGGHRFFQGGDMVVWLPVWIALRSGW
jgi:hypothetical protein